MNLLEHILDKANNPTKEEKKQFIKLLKKHAKKKSINKNKQL